MYGLFFDQSAQDSTQLIEYIRTWKTQHKLRSQEYLLKNLDELSSISKENGDKFTTVVAIGTEKTFEALVAQARNFPVQTVFAYIPTSHDLLARKIGVKDYKDACQVVTQRKITELTALSVNQEFFLFDYHLYPSTDNPSTRVDMFINKSMKVTMPTSHIVIHNRNQELHPHNSPILVEAFHHTSASQQSNNLFKLELSKKVRKKQDNEQLQLRLPASQLAIESATSLVNSQQTTIKLPIRVGLHSRVIRLVIKRGQDLQSIMAPGLIS